MIDSDFNLNYLRVFSWVYQKRSMTEAAKALHLTQSGVSQHIKSLEELLGVTLFDRLHRKLIPCPAADLLFEQCQKSFDELDFTIQRIQPESSTTLKGILRVGLPGEFGTNVILPLLARFAEGHPELSFEFTFGLAAEITEQLALGNLDFALVDHLQVDPRIHLEPVYSERLHLCIHPELAKEMGKFKSEIGFFQKLPYIAYRPGEPVLSMWFSHHFKRKKIHFKTRATAVDVRGVASLILARLGAGVLPNHLIERLKNAGQKIQLLEGPASTLENEISIATLQGRTHSRAVQMITEFLKDNLKVH